MGKKSKAKPKTPLPACRVCGCTESEPCNPPCGWHAGPFGTSRTEPGAGPICTSCTETAQILVEYFDAVPDTDPLVITRLVREAITECAKGKGWL